ncbi:MAG: anthranilate phosphoribosyltransferase [Mariprofundales bacterium]|nr:anthranilate phosphoribosyltransferase [Mariprofundales bacterium]
MTNAVQSLIVTLHQNGVVNGAMTEAAFAAIMGGEASSAQIGALLMGMALRGESAAMVAGAARAMRAAAHQVEVASDDLLDTCGTGGDGGNTFNISTTVALVVAACGQRVAKHGNRAISSRSGSADVLEALGVNLALSAQQVADSIECIGIGFIFAPQHHPAMKHAALPRRELGVRTLFNLLGPLTNPAGAALQVIGVYSSDILELMAQSVVELGIKRALIVHGRDGLDEISTVAISDAILVDRGELHPFEIDPEAFGMPFAVADALKGGDAACNASIIRHILAGQQGAGRDIVLLNAAAALWVCGRVDGIGDGIVAAARAIDSGDAAATLVWLIAFSQAAA